MPSDKPERGRFLLSDFIALGIALVLAFAIWMTYNLSSSYSGVLQCDVVALCHMEGYSDRSRQAARLVARCETGGFDLLGQRLLGIPRVEVLFDEDDLVKLSPTRFCVTASSLDSYSHAIFTDAIRVEHFVTDTLFFDFPQAEYLKLPVHLVSEISFRPQYTACGPVALTPDSVLVYGPEEQLAGLSCVNTRPLVLEDLESDAIGSVDLERQGTLTYSKASTQYRLTVCRFVEETLDLPVKVTGLLADNALSVYPSRATVVMRLRFPYDEATLEGLSVTVSFEQFENGRSGKCTGTLSDTPPDLISYEITPDVFNCVAYDGNRRP